MRAHPPARLIWLLLAAVLGLFPLQGASGAVLTWNAAPEREDLVFTFDSPLPIAEPRQRGLTRVLIPIPGNFWEKEPRPAIPDLSASGLLQRVAIDEDGVLVETRNGDFIFSSSSDPERRELTLLFFPPPPAEPTQPEPPSRENATQGAANASLPSDAVPAPNDNATEPVAPAEPEVDLTPVGAGPALSGTASVRGRIARPEGENPRLEGSGQEGQGAGEAEPQYAAAMEHTDFRIRMPIDWNATPPLPTSPEAGDSRLVPDGSAAPAPLTPDTGPVDNEAANASQPQAAPAPSPAMDDGPVDNASEDTVPQVSPEAPDEPSDHAALETEHAEPANATGEETAQSPAPETVNATVDANASAATGNATDNSTAELEALYRQAQTALAAGDLKTGRQAMTAMIEHPGAPEALREELLYNLADITMQQGKGDLEGNYTAIVEAYEAAKYADPTSSNVAEALYRIGYLNLSVGNIPEAKGNFDLLRRQYPDNPRVAMIDVFWGDHFLSERQPAKAADHFRYVIQNFPMSPAVKPAHVGLLKAFTELGFFGKAMEVVRDMEKRWPRYYLEDPSFLMAAGYAAMLSGDNDRALEYFWAYANIVPEAPDADVAMARIGDIHLKQNKPNAAREIYHRTAEAYPDREGGLIAQMRLAEEGVLDKPSMGDMAPVFDRPETDPEEIYQRILTHTESPLAPVARLKLAMWRLWKKDFAGSLGDARRFLEDYPSHELLPKAREVVDSALRDWIARDLGEENFQAVVQSWNDHRDLYAEKDLPPETRLMVATALMRTGQAGEALDMAAPFVFGSMPKGEFSEAGMDLVLAVLVDMQQWKRILELEKRVAPWDLGPERRRQVDYAAALAHEKLEQPAQATALWNKLATNLDLTDTQRGYAHYFLGRAALAAGQLERATILGQEALELLKKEKDDIPKLKETLELLVQAAERSGRDQEALAWSLEYDGYVSPDEPGWPAHAYRKAILYRKNDDLKNWRQTLNKLKELFPNSLYGRMAGAELEGLRLKREVEKFR